MKTRMELWKKYRNEINNNVELEKAVNISNEKLKILYERLIKVYPEYNHTYKISNPKNKFKFLETSSSPKFSTKKIEAIQEKIKSVSEFDDAFKSTAEIDFSSHELDDILKNIISRKHKSNETFKNEEKTGVYMNSPKIVALKSNNFPLKKKDISIAIDGPSGSGKSTIAKKIAQKYKLNYINTGLVYRAIALNAMNEKVDLNSENELLKSIKNGMIKLLKNEVVLLKGINVSDQLRSNEISQVSSKISTYKKVREWAVSLQQHYGKQGNVIMDGRDTTFKIMPYANFKFFLETSPEVRAQRRSKQNKELGFDDNYEKILKEIKERDFRDKNREIDPLHRTKTTILIDATNLTIEQVLIKMSIIIEKGEK